MESVARWELLSAWIIGTTGSVAYFTVVYFGFVGPNKESRDSILGYFWGKSGRMTVLKVAWYSLIGGSIAGIFQLAETAFVPVQSFILGATWPSIVGQLLSGRQSGQSGSELAAKKGITVDTASLEAKKTGLNEREAKDLLAELDKLRQGGIPPPV